MHENYFLLKKIASTAVLLEICGCSGTADRALGFIQKVNILAYGTGNEEKRSER